MADKVTLITLKKNDSTTTGDLNTNFTRLADQVDKQLSRDGSTPNYLNVDIDMNDFKVKNLGEPSNASDAARKKDVDGQSLPAQDTHGGQFLKTDGSAANWNTVVVDDLGNAQLVNATAAGQVLIYDATDGQFENTTLTSGSGVTVTNADASITVAADESNINHDSLQNFVSNEHIDHSNVSVSAGTALSGGGDITASRTLNLDINNMTSLTANAATDDLLAIFDSSASSHKEVNVNELLGARTLTGGDGIQALGDLSADRTVAVDSTVLRDANLAAKSGTVPETNRNNDFGKTVQKLNANGGALVIYNDNDNDNKKNLIGKDSSSNDIWSIEGDEYNGAGAGGAKMRGAWVIGSPSGGLQGSGTLNAELYDLGERVLDVATDRVVTATLTYTERSSDPSDPNEGNWLMWMSDGTESGADGDIMMKITAGGTTKTITLVDFSNN